MRKLLVLSFVSAGLLAGCGGGDYAAIGQAIASGYGNPSSAWDAPRTHYDPKTDTMKRCAHVTADGGCAHKY